MLAKNFPKAERFEDVRECGRHNLRPVDVICGGFPCQDISVAGNGLGLAGRRSGLWREMHRTICELRPNYVLVENVANLLFRGASTVLGNLAEIGYDAEWEIVSAAQVGADHLRERMWIIAYPDGTHDTNSFVSNFIPKREEEDIKSWGRGLYELGAISGNARRSAYADIVRAWDGIPKRVDRLRGLGNAVVPQIPEMYARKIAQYLKEKS